MLVNLAVHYNTMSFKRQELRTLMYMFYTVRNQLTMYTEALDVKSYAIAVLASDNY